MQINSRISLYQNVGDKVGGHLPWKIRTGSEERVLLPLNLNGCWVWMCREESGLREKPKYRLDTKIARCIFIGKQFCLFYVVYFGWAEPSWPRGFSLAAVSRADSRLRCVASPCGGSPAAGRGLPGTVLAARGLRSCAA